MKKIALSLCVAATALFAQSQTATYKIGVTVAQVNAGETFVFGLAGTPKLATITKGGTSVYFPGTFDSSYAYQVVQVSGPRTCFIASKTGIVYNSDIETTADCGSATDKYPVTGFFYAPQGTTIVVQNNNTDDLSLIAEKDSSNSFSRTPFSFPTKIADRSAYSVTVKTAPEGIACRIKDGQGIASQYGARPIIECDHKFELLSRSTRDSSFSTYYESSSPAVGGAINNEGRYVVFVSNAVGFCGTTGKHKQIFWRDRNTGTTKLVSFGLNGEEGDGDSFAPSISIDGRSVAFESYSTNLVEKDANGVRDIFVWNFFNPKIERVSVGPGGIEANAESFEPSLGTGVIAYSSNASNLTDGVEGTSLTNVYWRHLYSGEQKLISMDPVTHKGVGGSKPSIFMNGGNRLVFYSTASTLVPNDNNGLWDIFFYQVNQPLKRVSMTSDGSERNQGTESATRIVAPSISGDGRFVAFATTASNMVPNDNNNAQDVFVVNLETNEVRCASRATDASASNGDSPIGPGEKVAINYDGSLTAFSTKASNLGTPESNIVLHNSTTGETRAVTTIAGSSVGVPVLSQKANYVIFGMGTKLDGRYPSSGIFAAFTNLTGTRLFYQTGTSN